MKNLLIALLFLPMFSFAQSEPADKTFSPYFMVNGAVPGVDAMPLKSTIAEVNIAGVIAEVIVTQTYLNTGKKPLEAIYVFPGSTRAAVYGMSMQVGQRIITAKIAERQTARAQYEQAKTEGKRASLLEQERPNVFQMNVANIMPGDTIRTVLRYTELLIPEAGVYEFVYPTVVGPRYTNGQSGNNNGFTAIPYGHKGAAPSYTFDLSAHINAGMPLQEISSTSHIVHITDNGAAGSNLVLDPIDNVGGNRDFKLRYALRGKQIETGLLLYDDGKEKFFLCMAQPPKRVAKDDIPPREYIFVVDVSGSMNGFPLTVSKTLLRNLVAGIRPTDVFNIILFAGTSNTLAPNSVSATNENVEQAIAFIDRQEGSGGTNLLPALQNAFNLPRNAKGLSRSVVVVTDGYVDVEAEAFDLVRKNLDKTNVFAFGIGSSVNHHLIEGLAHVGAGVPFTVMTEQEGAAIAERFRRYIATPVLTNIKVQYPGFEAYDVEPSSVPDVFSERPVVLMGKWRGNAQGEIVLSGKVGKKNVTMRTDITKAIPDDRNAAIKYLWARERIKLLGDYDSFGENAARDAAITKLGLDYNLLTAFTSFIAIDEVIASDGKLTTVKQPLPLPQGVSDLAVGFDLGISGISGEAHTTNGIAWVLLYILFVLGGLWSLRDTLKKSGAWVLFGLIVLGATSCSTSPVAITEGDSITFLLGEDRTERNPYFSSAATYFRSDSIEKTAMLISDCHDLKAVHAYLASHKPANGPWRRINFVVHGNEWTGMCVPIEAKGERTTAKALESAVQKGVFPALPSEHVDSSTRLSVFACNIGRDKALLAALEHAFSGVAVVSSPYFNIFESSPDNPKKVQRYLADYRYVVFPAGTFPGNKSVAQDLSARYPSDTINWNAALQRLRPRFEGDAYVHYFSIPVQWTTLYHSEKERPTPQTDTDYLRWVHAQPELMAEIDKMGLKPEQFQWKLQAGEYPNDQRPAIFAEGRAMIYCVLKPV